MPSWYMDQGGGVAVFLIGDFASATEADTYANGLGIFGTPVEQSVWESSPTVLAVELDSAKREKLGELQSEGDARCLAVSPLFDSVLAAARLSVTFKNNALENTGKDLRDVGDAFNAAALVILGLPDVASVLAYDVVTDPGWP